MDGRAFVFAPCQLHCVANCDRSLQSATPYPVTPEEEFDGWSLPREGATECDDRRVRESPAGDGA
jgi:hypothetical protein